jgi:hypothetical protein
MFLDNETVKSSIALMRYKVCRALFLNRAVEVMDLFDKNNVSIRSNWEIVISLPLPSSFIIIGEK